MGNVVSGTTLKDKSCYDIEIAPDDKVLVLSEEVDILDKNKDVIEKGNFEGNITRFDTENNDGDFRVYISMINSNNSDIAVDPKNTFVVKGLNINLEELYNVEIPGEVKGIAPYKDKLIVYSGRSIYLIDDRGKTLLSKDINRDIIDVKWLSENKIILVDKTDITIIDLDNGRKK